MKKSFTDTMKSIFTNKSLMKKIFFTLLMLALYRLLVHIPLPIADISVLRDATTASGTEWLGYFLMLLWGSIKNFSFIAIWLAPYINSSIIMQLLTAIVPKLEQLSEEWESGKQKISQYTRLLMIPLAFVQGIWMVYFMNYLLGTTIIDPTFTNLIFAGFCMTVWATMMMWIWELITEKGVSNGISLLIFASIVSWITSSVYSSFSATDNFVWMFIFMMIIVLALILLSIFVLKSIKEIPIVYSRKWSVKESSMLPIPLNPVGMIPIIFAMAFVSFPYLISQMITQFQPGNLKLMSFANRVEANLNIYSQTPGWLAIILFFLLIILFTFFYALITFSPDSMSDNIQKRWGFIPGIRPGKETASYINKILMHLCLWGGAGLWFIGVYNYVLYEVPFISSLAASFGGIPVIVMWSWVIIMVWVVQEILNKVQTELVMQKYENLDPSTINKKLSEL